jgi:hypothetical protein
MAQKPTFYLGFDQIFDNREYYNPFSIDQTIFGARINPGVVFSIDTVNQVHVGLNYMYEFGGELYGVPLQIDLYYSYSSEKLQLRFGSFPRRDVMEYPLMLLTDSLNYYRPNIEGGSVAYNWSWGEAHGWVDWTGRMSPEKRESILYGIDASLRKGSFFLTAIATWYHMAFTSSHENNVHILDDGAIAILAGVDLAKRTGLELLDFSSGWVTTHTRTRPADIEWFNGWLTLAEVKYRIAGIKATYYLGDPSHLAYGDRLYASGNYARMDLYIDPFKNPRISSKFSWNLHFLPGYGLFHSQQILFSIKL